jgi:hypothetical protein
MFSGDCRLLMNDFSLLIVKQSYLIKIHFIYEQNRNHPYIMFRTLNNDKLKNLIIFQWKTQTQNEIIILLIFLMNNLFDLKAMKLMIDSHKYLYFNSF